MSEVQRWNINHVLGRVYIDEKSEGGWVTYADHVAAVAAAQREGAKQGYLNGVATNADNSFKAGVKAARDAVAYLQEVRRMGGLKYALAAIDKVVKP